MRTWTVFVLAAVAGLGCSRKEAAPQESVVRIGQLLDRTGSSATPSWSDALRLAVGTANEALRQAGQAQVRFLLVERNSANSAEVARAGALDLVRKEGVRAIVTDSSQDAIAVNKLAYEPDRASRLAVPIVCMACTAAEINDPAAVSQDPLEQAALRNLQGWSFRTSLSNAYQVAAVARILLGRGRGGDVNRDGKFKLSIYASDEAYGRGFSNDLRAVVRRLRPTAEIEQIFHDPRVDPRNHDWAADVARLVDRQSNTDGIPDAVVEITFSKFAIAFTRAWLASGTRVPLLHTHNFRTSRTLEALKDSLEGQEGTSQVVLGEGPSAAAFAADLKSETGQAPAFRDATAYDAAMSLVLATLVAARDQKLSDPAKVTGAQIRDALHAINQREGVPVYAGISGIAAGVRAIAAGKPIDYQGASGPCDFDERGNIVADLARFRVVGHEFVDVERYACTRDASCSRLPLIGVR